MASLQDNQLGYSVSVFNKTVVAGSPNERSSGKRCPVSHFSVYSMARCSSFFDFAQLLFMRARRWFITSTTRHKSGNSRKRSPRQLLLQEIESDTQCLLVEGILWLVRHTTVSLAIIQAMFTFTKEHLRIQIHSLHQILDTLQFQVSILILVGLLT